MAEKKTKMVLSPRQNLDDQTVRRISGSAIEIATWNVRSLFEAGKLSNAIHEMDRMKIDILGISKERYGDEGWTLTKALEKRLEAFEVWLYHRMRKIS